ncbi:MAG: M1 family metallopeptidase [Bacteroidetes bacterium]|nr:M1 family metallopeptidase [Bacteroidota bacterium]
MTRAARWLILPLLLLAIATVSSPAQILYGSVESGRAARTHRFDVLHIAAVIRFNDPARTVIGSVKHRIRSLDSSLAQIRLDAGRPMEIEKVLVDNVAAAHEQRGDTLVVTLPSVRRYGDTFTVAIDYHVVPAKGLYFIQPDSLLPDRRHQIWTQGEDEDNRYWLPCYDYPNDRATSELWITVPKSWSALSNGRLADVKSEADGSRTWHYMQEKPHASYLIMLAAGDYLVTRDTVDGVPLEYWTYPDMPDRVKPTFSRTPDVIRYFSRQLGVPYPWHKYAQIMIADFMYGGMENTSATTLNDYALVDQRGLLDYNTDGLVAHEAAHQWFGDLVTNRSWGHLWLHESFATYLASRYRGYRSGQDVFAKEIFDSGLGGIQSDKGNGRDPIANGKGVTSNIYDRGSRVLHMLNRVIGEEAFWRGCRLYLERNAYGNAETDDLKHAFEDASGVNLGWFFDEWLYKAGAPAYRVRKSFSGDTLQMRVEQTQERDSLTDLFRMPVAIEFHYRDHVRTDTVWVEKEEETFSFVMKERPSFVVFDAGDAILKTVDYERPEEELLAQLDAPRMIDRLLAVRAIGTDTSQARNHDLMKRRSQAMLDHYRREGSPFVRQQLLERVAAMEPDIAAQMLSAGAKDTAADVRRAAAEYSYVIAGKHDRSRLLRPLLSDRSYNVISAALGMMATTDTTDLISVLRRLKGAKSRRDRLASAWLNAVAAGHFNALAPDVAEYTSPRYRDETRSLAYFTLAKLDSTTAEIRLAILRGLAGPPTLMRAAAASAARKHMDSELKSRIVKMRDSAPSGEEKDFMTKLLEA